MPSTQVAVPKKMPPGKPEKISGFLRFSRFSSLFQKWNFNEDKKIPNPFWGVWNRLELKSSNFLGIFDDNFSSNMPLFSFYKY